MMKTDYKQDFPLLLQKEADGRILAYLDNAATTQKPRQVIDAVSDYYKSYNANTHRGAYSISVKATEAFEQVREKAARFIGAASPEEIVFTAGATDAINLAALSYEAAHVGKGDEILISVTEHHSNLLPWQRLAHQAGAELRYLLPDESGRISPEEVADKLTPRTKIVAITHISNVLGVVNPIKEITALAHEKGAVVLLDGAQSAPHIPVNVQDLDVDFMAFSGHKMLAPAGIGVLYGKKKLLQEMEPVRLGGGIVEEVTQQSVRYLDPPLRFEAGTQNAEGVIGLGAAIDYLEDIGLATVQQVEHRLTEYALQRLSGLPGVVLYGGQSAQNKTGIISFNVADVHPHDTATILATHGVAVRAGHHCAQPLMAHLGVNATCRMSLYFYNTQEDIDRLAEALKTVRGVLGFGAE
ncbi:cysteine desulfurase [Oscillospiraceae bacterium MB08-C2-2]|nr:cysteine desulfurase [Oscillospiraceae bacterium MB08-C2-2]